VSGDVGQKDMRFLRFSESAAIHLEETKRNDVEKYEADMPAHNKHPLRFGSIADLSDVSGNLCVSQFNAVGNPVCHARNGQTAFILHIGV